MIKKTSIKKSPSALKKIFETVVLPRDGYACQICGDLNIDILTYHHIIPKGRIRLDVAENLMTVCARCHIPKIHGCRDGWSVDRVIEMKKKQLGGYYRYNNLTSGAKR